MKKHKLIITFCFTVILVCAFLAQITSASAFSDGRLVFDIYYGKSVFRYIDFPIHGQNHIMQQDFEDRKLNADADQKIAELIKAKSEGKSNEDALDYVFPYFKNTISRMQKSIDYAATNSKITFRPNAAKMFTVSKEKNGLALNVNKLYDSIVSALISGKRTCVAATNTVAPKITYAQNIKSTYLRSVFSTDYSTSSENRKHNIALALNKINGASIASGKKFSFNARVGARTEKRGFKEAKIILNGQFSEGIGGGICQVSTTLYNAVIRADLTVTAVRNHSLPVSYVPPSFDAMVNSTTSDLKFENNTKGSIFIRAYTINDHATIEVYGQRLNYFIVPESDVISILPPPNIDDKVIDVDGKYTLSEDPSGTKVRVHDAKGGIISKGYLKFVDFNGNVIARRQIRYDKYNPQNGLIAIKP